MIISTYNSPEWLRKVLWGYLAQSEADFEIVIADDGSTAETGALLASFQGRFKFPLVHVWHPDDGFRKTVILNKAIAESSTDYLIFSDGDCIPRRDFVATHLGFREAGYFLSGGYYKLPLDLSREVTEDDVLGGRVFDLAWIWKRGKRRSLKDLKLAVGNPAMARLMNAATTTRPSWNGHNASGWKRDIVAVNGFDERMRYGAEDREMGDRLAHRGVRSKQIRYSAICVHLEHDRAYVLDSHLEANRLIWTATRQRRLAYTDFGISKTNGE
ncbi:glycosyltransferase [Jiella sonneratiae]|uniref:Glycosyltransferase family 2 protein n=1 Tax=Jiella sonneratiae TaxID=2816856 RepID=A0ABS3J5K4_9HYPH|nr:glycosyltransferase family 2 protein [Jiella sonneratiae]